MSRPIDSPWKEKKPHWTGRYPTSGNLTPSRLARLIHKRHPDLFDNQRHAKRAVDAVFAEIEHALLADRLVHLGSWALMGLRVWKGRKLLVRKSFDRKRLQEARGILHVPDSLGLASWARKVFRDKLRGLRKWDNL